MSPAPPRLLRENKPVIVSRDSTCVSLLLFICIRVSRQKGMRISEQPRLRRLASWPFINVFSSHLNPVQSLLCNISHVYIYIFIYLNTFRDGKKKNLWGRRELQHALKYKRRREKKRQSQSVVTLLQEGS